jgi:hypothetical protein
VRDGDRIRIEIDRRALQGTIDLVYATFVTA